MSGMTSLFEKWLNKSQTYAEQKPKFKILKDSILDTCLH